MIAMLAFFFSVALLVSFFIGLLVGAYWFELEPE